MRMGNSASLTFCNLPNCMPPSEEVCTKVGIARMAIVHTCPYLRWLTLDSILVVVAASAIADTSPGWVVTYLSNLGSLGCFDIHPCGSNSASFS